MQLKSGELKWSPTLLGFRLFFKDHPNSEAMITDETEYEIFVESDHFTGWIDKTEFWDGFGDKELGLFYKAED